MADLLVVLTIAGFMSLCAGYVAWCDRIIGASSASSIEVLSPIEDIYDGDFGNDRAASNA